MKTLRNIFAAAVLMASGAVPSFADCDVSLGVAFSDGTAQLTQQNRRYLTNIIRRAVSGSMTPTELDNAQICVLVTADVNGRHLVTNVAPAKTVLDLTVTLYVADRNTGTTFSSTSFDLNGVGNSEPQAYNNASRQLKAQNRELKDFGDKARTEVIAWYDRNIDNIINKARTEAAMRDYDSALWRLLSVPECCKGYDRAVAEAKVVYQQYVNRQCEENLAQAQAAWMAGYTLENAQVASVFLSEIYPDAACYKEAQELVKEIKKHMGERWKFEMHQWDTLMDVEKQRLTHAREIALAYAQNQPQTVISVIR